MAISGIGLPSIDRQGATPADGSKRVDDDAFNEALTRAATAVVKTDRVAIDAVNAFTEGAEGRLHETMMAIDKADINLKFLVNVRNRLVDAYREVMRMGA